MTSLSPDKARPQSLVSFVVLAAFAWLSILVPRADSLAGVRLRVHRPRFPSCTPEIRGRVAGQNVAARAAVLVHQTSDQAMRAGSAKGIVTLNPARWTNV